MTEENSGRWVSGNFRNGFERLKRARILNYAATVCNATRLKALLWRESAYALCEKQIEMEVLGWNSNGYGLVP
jgi:hypothetical protein